MPQNPITVIGNLTDDPKLNRTANGRTVCNFRIAASRSYRDEQGNWKDTDLLYLSGELWGPAAPNAKASLTKGMGVIATGRLVTEQWSEQTTDEHGHPTQLNRQRIVLRADRLGVDLTRHIASTQRTDNHSHQAHEGLEPPARQNLESMLDVDRYLPENSSARGGADALAGSRTAHRPQPAGKTAAADGKEGE